ncbi:MAG TPA: hypothetical protein VHE80_02540, partial [Acidimicrobiales bacterium]|nr:hypothetical protein [Acidimicrobiales bacterium]
GQRTAGWARAVAAGAAVVGGLLALAYAWWVVSLPPFSGWATVVVLLTGAAAVALGAARRRPERRGRRATGAGVWVALAAVMIVAGYAGLRRRVTPSWTAQAIVSSNAPGGTGRPKK